MKKVFSMALMALVMCAVSACSGSKSPVERLDALTTKLEKADKMTMDLALDCSEDLFDALDDIDTDMSGQEQEDFLTAIKRVQDAAESLRERSGNFKPDLDELTPAQKDRIMSIGRKALDVQTKLRELGINDDFGF